MKHTLNPVRQRELLDQDYVSINDLMELYGWSRKQATKEFKTISFYLTCEGKPEMTRGRTMLIPLDRILKEYPMNYQRVDRAAKRILQGDV